MTTLTDKGAATRDRIVTGAAAVMRARGVVNTSLDDIRDRTRTSKSQLFHYFPDGKTELLLAVARLEADQILADQLPHLDDLSTWKSWQAWRDVVVERYRQQGRSCPLSVLMTQLDRTNPATQAIVVDLLTSWRGSIADGIRRMQSTGKVGSRVDADETASAILAGLQGGVVMMLSTGEMTHLEAALDVAIRSLRASRSAR